MTRQIDLVDAQLLAQCFEVRDLVGERATLPGVLFDHGKRWRRAAAGYASTRIPGLRLLALGHP